MGLTVIGAPHLSSGLSEAFAFDTFPVFPETFPAFAFPTFADFALGHSPGAPEAFPILVNFALGLGRANHALPILADFADKDDCDSQTYAKL